MVSLVAEQGERPRPNTDYCWYSWCAFVIWREYSTHRAAKAAERQAKTAANRHEKQTQADLDRRITDNFTKAVELLGSNKLEVRLGGIYALERIARESKRDHWPIMETLTAYVRIRLPIQHTGQEVSGSDESRSSANSADETAEVKERSRDLPVDVQAVLTVLSRRKAEHDAEGELINLSGVDLRWFDLAAVKLIRVNLSWSNLREANLIQANLSEADLRWADLSRANLTEADLTGASLRKANLTEADLRQAALIQADLRKANLRRADLRGARLNAAVLENTKFCKTTMPDGTVNNRDCPPEPAAPNPSEKTPVPD
jgi:uncharacterized protein YjbI with pentapeptide repeats